MPILQDNSHSIGRTPLVRINRLTEGLKANVLAKIEGRNPAYSVKCRIGAAMIWDAEERGVLKPGMQVVEPTSGNTGIALAFVCAAMGYSLSIVTSDAFSLEKRNHMRALGANDVEGAVLSDTPEEYRDLVNRYFREVARESAKKGGQ